MAARMFALGDAKRRVLDLAFVLTPVAIIIAGCTNQLNSDPQIKEDKAAAEEAAKETSSIDDARCQSYGFQPGSPGYVQCRKDIDNERKQMGIKE
jgi:hypothetical protein